MKILSGLYLFLFAVGLCAQTSNEVAASEAAISGELKKWHKIELVFGGPESSEMADNNPFLNYRLDVSFSNGENVYVVPGFYAADGNAAETSADEEPGRAGAAPRCRNAW